MRSWKPAPPTCASCTLFSSSFSSMTCFSTLRESECASCSVICYKYHRDQLGDFFINAPRSSNNAAREGMQRSPNPTHLVEGILETLLRGVRAAADGFGVVPGERAGWVGVVPLRERVSSGKSSIAARSLTIVGPSRRCPR